jgi:hypothetical protein
VEINLKSELMSSSTLVAEMVLPEITYMEVATMLVKKALIDLKTTFTQKDNDNHSASPTPVEAKMLQWT